MMTLTNIRFLRAGETIIPRMDLTVGHGEVMMIRGGNGCGKTTLLRIIAGLLQPAEGMQTRYEGAFVRMGDAGFRGALMFIGHHLGLKLDLSALENLQFFNGFCGDGRTTPRQALERVGLNGYAQAAARRLSAGQKKRLALARLLLNERPLWLLDEPYSNLDQPGIALVDTLLGEHAKRGGAAIVTSHGTFVPQVPRLLEVAL